jgi:hypothetical protein
MKKEDGSLLSENTDPGFLSGPTPSFLSLKKTKKDVVDLK